MIGPKVQKMTDTESRREYTRAAERSFGLCEGCGDAQAIQMHHRLHRSHGGDERPENLLHLCRACHADAHADTDRYVIGRSVRSGFDPAVEPVLYRGVFVKLTADGGIDEGLVA